MTIDTDAKDGYVKTEVHNNILIIEFYHPQSNSLPSPLIASLVHEIDSAARNIDIHVIVLRAAGGGAFCAGASFDELLTIEDEQQGAQFFNGFASIINAMRKCPKLIVARVHGKCVGGGVGLAAAADYTIALEGADVKLSELSIGIGPLVIGPAVERKIGLSAYSELAIDSTAWRSSDWAKRKGLYAGLHPTPESMDEAIARLTSALAHTSPEAAAEMKKVFWHDTDHWDMLLQERAAISGKLVLSSYTKECLRKFKEKKL
ncbi:enoyl-CoA hydratase/isomerase family protein [Ilyomonas limi]|uniref:Enoyl-CoA hydratase/isomerase family protein n=1 Tax=Ilyomonas limi TaxID=2575867 RepID=A0A4U3LAF4_9BACT|nr:enoyl-CoA hydratase/isomerase family protein [Ilyomonas limi]TKK70757.1 enoyl-CoA hydratase/isomerase family protein [Ilyomonas limi]